MTSLTFAKSNLYALTTGNTEPGERALSNSPLYSIPLRPSKVCSKLYRVDIFINNSTLLGLEAVFRLETFPVSKIFRLKGCLQCNK